jgi:ELWxxDGT repeat protein
VLLADINAVGSSYPTNLTVVGSTVFFAADDGVHGYELWKTNGQTATLVRDINESSYVDPFTQEDSPAGSFPTWLTAVSSTLYFVADDLEHGTELWKSDGTAAGTVLVKDINVSPDTTVSDPDDPSFVATFGSGPAWLTAAGTTLYFTADDGVKGRELWKTTGTAAGTSLVKDINTAVDSSDPDNPVGVGSDPGWLTAVGTTLYFAADDGTKGRELWKSTGTAAGTVLVKDINTGIDDSDPDNVIYLGSDPQFLTNVNGKLYFAADGSDDPYYTNTELWRSDGTAAGTSLVEDINDALYEDPETGEYTLGSNPSHLTDVSGKLYFSASRPVVADPDSPNFGGTETLLFATIGATGVTSEITSADPSGKTADGVVPFYGDFASASTNYALFKDALYFAASNGTSGFELWKSDGTAAGTVLVKDIKPGSESSAPVYDDMGYNAQLPFDFAIVGSTLFFVADGPAGEELWKTDGTTAGTVQVKDIAAGSEGSYPHSLTVVNGTLYYVADDGKTGAELWKSNGTAAGTTLVKNIHPDVTGGGDFGSGSYLSSSYPSDLQVIGSTLYFAADDGVHGKELWKTDGTAAGTVLVADIDDYVDDSGSAYYAASSYPSQLRVVGTTLYFSAEDSIHGRRLWKSDGTPAGTTPVADGNTDQNWLTPVGDKLFFTTSTPGGLWVLDGSEAGTQQLTGGPSDPQFLTAVGDFVYFVEGQSSLWRSNGTVAGTEGLFVDELVDPRDLRSIFGTLYFTAEDAGTSIRSLYAVDPQSPTGYSLIVDGTSFSRLAPLRGAFGTVLVQADDGQVGLELWKADAIGEKPTVAIGIDRTAFKKGDTATVTFTLSEASTGFAANDVTVTGGSLSNFAGSGTSYTAKFTPAAQFVGTGAISVGSGGFLGGLGLANTAAALADELLIDTADPTVTIGSNKASLKAGDTATITFTLNKPSTTFAIDDVVASGGSLSDFTGSGSSYSATFTPSASSLAAGAISVAASKFTDAAGNPNVAGSLSPTIKIDSVLPTIAITSNKTALKIGETAVIQFTLSEPLTSFSLSGVNVGGGVLSNPVGSGTKYTATFTPSLSSTTDGTIVLAKGAGSDAAGNPSQPAALAPAIKIDTLAPTLTIGTDKPTLRAGQTATITFTLSESATDFALADVTATGGKLANFTGSGSTYTAVFTPTANSTTSGGITVTAGKFKDAAGNANTAGSLSPSIGIDTIAPTLKITTSAASLKAGETATISFLLSESSGDFGLDDVVATGGSLSDFSGSGASYSATFTPSILSVVPGAISVAAARFTDAAGNPNVAGGLPAQIKLDTAPPTVAISSSVAALAKGKTAKIAFLLNEDSKTFTASDVVVTGGVLSGFAGKGKSYSATFTPTAGFNGTGTVAIAEGTFADLAGNPNVSGASLAPQLKIDSVAPTLTIASDKASLKANETATITFSLSEDSTDFVLADVVAAGGTLSAFTGSNSTYSAIFTPKPGSTSPGSISVAAGKFTDAAGNPNTAATLPASLAISTVQPIVKITADKAALKAGESGKITFAVSESVTDFTVDDVTATGGTLSAFAGSGKAYTATFTPDVGSTTNGLISIAAGKLTNTAGNGNPFASLAAAIKIDTQLPTIAITSDLPSLTVGTKAKITFTLSEASTTFAASDVTVTNGTLSGFTGTGTTYTATFTAKTGFKGTGTISVAAGKFTDKAGNNNLAGELAGALTIDT